MVCSNIIHVAFNVIKIVQFKLHFTEVLFQAVYLSVDPYMRFVTFILNNILN